MVTDLIIPAVKRKELVMREKGLVALGLCCLIAKVVSVSDSERRVMLFAENGSQFVPALLQPSPDCTGGPYAQSLASHL